jgi:protein TonB
MPLEVMLLIFFTPLLSIKAAGQYQLPRFWDPKKLSKSDSLTNGIPVEKDTAIYEDVDHVFNICIFPVEASYRGGIKRWRRFLYKNLRYPNPAIDSNVQGIVIVKFVVESNGEITGIESVSGPNVLRAEVERVIRKSKKWRPAVLNKKKIKSYKSQPFIFRFGECDDQDFCCK